MRPREIVRGLYGVDQPQGCTDEEIAALMEVMEGLGEPI